METSRTRASQSDVSTLDWPIFVPNPVAAFMQTIDITETIALLIDRAFESCRRAMDGCPASLGQVSSPEIRPPTPLAIAPSEDNLALQCGARHRAISMEDPIFLLIAVIAEPPLCGFKCKCYNLSQWRRFTLESFRDAPENVIS